MFLREAEEEKKKMRELNFKQAVQQDNPVALQIQIMTQCQKEMPFIDI